MNSIFGEFDCFVKEFLGYGRIKVNDIKLDKCAGCLVFDVVKPVDCVFRLPPLLDFGAFSYCGIYLLYNFLAYST